MVAGLAGQAAVVGVGATPLYRRGQSLPATPLELAIAAMRAALDDAGLTVKDIDGFALYAGGLDTSGLTQMLGIPHVGFTSMITGGGGGAAGSIGLAAAAITAGFAEVVMTVIVAQQPPGARLGARAAAGANEGPTTLPYPFVNPGQFFAILAQRHMHLYGTRREHLAEVAISTRNNAARRPSALMRDEVTLDDYLSARMISEPLCIYDFCLESDGAVAIVTTSSERAADLRQPAVQVVAATQGGDGNWGTAMTWFGMPDEDFLTTGSRTLARTLFQRGGLTPGDVDVALFYDHFTPAVLLQLEDYGFCDRGESGPFVAEGNIRWPDGRIPVNTHGGNLSEGYVFGLTHVKEAVEQLRGTAVNQVRDAEVALVTGGPGIIPASGLLLSR